MAGWVTGGYPGGSVQLEAGDDFPWKQNPCKLILHSTETAGFPDYPRNKAPQVTVHPKARQWRQHRRLDQPAWALAAPAGYPSTNSMGAIQIEIVAYAATLKNLDGGDLEYLIGFIRFILAQTGIPATCTVLFGGAETYGINGPKRMSSAQWTAYRGICGHQHVPGNSHWDPGDLPMQSKWLPMIQGQPEPEPTPEDVSEVSVIQGYGQTDIWWSTDTVSKTRLTTLSQVKDILRLNGKIGAAATDAEARAAIVIVGGETINALKTFETPPTATAIATEVWSKQPPVEPVEVVVNSEVIAAAVVAAINAQGVDISAETATEIASQTFEQIKTLTYKAV